MRVPMTTAQRITLKTLDSLLATAQREAADAGVEAARTTAAWQCCSSEANCEESLDAEHHYRALQNVQKIIAKVVHDYVQTIGGR